MKIINLKVYFSSFILASFFSGCFMPYKNEFTCNKGVGEGVCDSVSNVYNSYYMKEESKTLKKEDIATNVLIDKCNDLPIEMGKMETYHEDVEKCRVLTIKNYIDKKSKLETNYDETIKYLYLQMIEKEK